MARDVRAGRAFIELYLQDNKFRRDIRFMRRRLGGMAKTVAGIASAFTAVGVAAGTVAVAGILKATNAAGDLAETVSKFETVFGDLSPQVRKFADTVARTMGVTRREVLDTLSGFQDLFVPIGIDPRAAMEMSQTLATLAVDLASFNNLRVADTVRDLQAAMTGSSETMKKYGVIVDAAAVKQELLNMGLDPKNATNAEKAQARLALILRSTTAAQGDAIRTAGSWANQTKQLRVAFQELLTDIGEKFLPVMTDLLKVANEGMQDLRESIQDIIPAFEGLPTAMITMAKQGQWERLGQIVATQIQLGLRKAIPEELQTILGLWSRLAGFSRRQLATVAQTVTQGPPGLQEMLGNRVPATDDRITRLQEQLASLLREAEKQTEVQKETRSLLEAAPPFVAE